MLELSTEKLDAFGSAHHLALDPLDLDSQALLLEKKRYQFLACRRLRDRSARSRQDRRDLSGGGSTHAPGLVTGSRRSFLTHSLLTAGLVGKRRQESADLSSNGFQLLERDLRDEVFHVDRACDRFELRLCLIEGFERLLHSLSCLFEILPRLLRAFELILVFVGGSLEF